MFTIWMLHDVCYRTVYPMHHCYTNRIQICVHKISIQWYPIICQFLCSHTRYELIRTIYLLGNVWKVHTKSIEWEKKLYYITYTLGCIDLPLIQFRIFWKEYQKKRMFWKESPKNFLKIGAIFFSFNYILGVISSFEFSAIF